MPGPVIIEQNLASGASCESDGRLPDRGKLDRAMQDAVEEAAKPQPDKDEIGSAVGRAVKYAKSAEDFGNHLEKLLPRLTAIASWAGAAGRGLLAMAGITI